MKNKSILLGIAVVQMLILSACGTNHTQKKSDTSSQAASSRRLASLKKENEKLKHQKSQSSAASSVTVNSEQSSSQDQSSSEATSAAPTVAPDGATAEEMRGDLVSNFGCDAAALRSVPDGFLVQQYTESEEKGGDIGVFYERVVSSYPSIGGNIMGPDTSSANNDDSDDENE